MNFYVLQNYLESTGTQYIGLPLIANVNSTLSFEGEMIPRYKNGVSTNWYVFNTNPQNQLSGHFYSKNATTNKILYASYSGNNAQSGGWGSGTEVDVKGNFIISTEGRTSYSTGQYSTLHRPLTQNVNMFYLFGNYTGNRCPIAYGKLFIKVDNIAIYELIPVRVGQVGYMYDKVSNQLFGNSGTGNFILGNDMN